MDSQKIKTLVIVVLAALFAVYIGVAAATAKLELLAWTVGTVAMICALALGKHIWVIIPISLGLTGTINALPGSPPALWFAIFATLVMMGLRFVMRTNELRLRFTWLDFAILLQAIAVGQSWIRNPAGMAIFGGDSVGGKSNLAFTFAIISYLILASVKTDLTIFKRLTLLTLAVAIADGLLSVASERYPGLAGAILPLYSGVMFVSNLGMTGISDIDISGVRMVSAMQLGNTLGIAALTFFPPLSVINPTKPVRFLMFCAAVVLVLLSGFRSIIGMFLILFVVGSFIRGRMRDVMVASMLAPLMLSLLVLSGQTRSLPFGAQRILSVLPIDVDARARADGSQSSEWRFEMWRLALYTDRYIKNKFLGDGFGYRADEQRAMEDAAMGDHRRGGAGVDTFLARGSFHGFHVETIRFTGFLGLIAALIGMGIFARTAWKLIRYYRNRPEWMYVLYLCIPFLIHPFYYMLVFGSYKNAFPVMLATAGLLKVLDNIRRDELAAAEVEAPVSDMPEQRLPGHTRGPLMAQAR
jgi:hypothetical protein